jgi:hypothetical protein
MTGLIGWLPFHRRVGDAVDLSGRGNDGTINGPVRGVAGRGGLQAYSFDGSDDYVQTGTDVFSNADLDRHTISCWVRPLDLSNTQILNYNEGNCDLRIQSDGTAEYIIFDGSSGFTLNSSALTLDEWVHIVGTYDGSTQRLYVDGSEVASQSANAPDPDGVSRPNGFGWNGDLSSQYFNGKATDIRTYDRELSAAEVTRLYECGSGDYAEPPSDVGDADAVSYWTFDESSGDAIDEWGSNDGSVTGATQGATGIRNTAYSFDGSDDEVVVSDDATISAFSKVTVSLWTKPDKVEDEGTSAGNIGGIACKSASPESGSANLEYAFTQDPRSSSLYFNWRVSDGSTTINNTLPFSRFDAGEWYHFTGVWDGTTSFFYVNGVLENTESGGFTGFLQDTTYALNIGGDNDTNGRYYDGDTDDVRIYSRELSPFEVAQVYRYGSRGKDLRKKTTNAR